jgi:hypothetical protein
MSREFFFAFYFTIWCNNYNRYPKIFEVCIPFSYTLPSHYTVIIRLYQLVVNFNGRTFHPYKADKIVNFFTGPTFHCYCHHTLNFPMSGISLTLVPPVAFYPCYKYYLLQKDKILDQHKVTC